MPAEQSDELNGSGNARSLPAQRRREIAQYVSMNGHATIAGLAEMFAVSSDTVRRDLAELSSRGILLRTHGGVVSGEAAASIQHLTFHTRAETNLSAKRDIALAAAALIANRSTVLINGGTTVLEFARALQQQHGLTVLTNNLEIPRALPPSAVAEVHILGGQYDPSSLVTLGPIQLPNQYGTETHHVHADYAVLGVGGISLTVGFTGTDVRESSMIRAMMERSSTVIILADSSKFGRNALVEIADLGRADFLVTDCMPDRPLVSALEEAGVHLVVANEVTSSLVTLDGSAL